MLAGTAATTILLVLACFVLNGCSNSEGSKSEGDGPGVGDTPVNESNHVGEDPPGVEFDGDTLSMAFYNAGTDKNGTVTKMEFVVMLKKDSWLGIGFSTGDSPSMSAGGEGVDGFFCPEGGVGAVKRYWITSSSLPATGDDVANSTCSFNDGYTMMSFIRSISAANDKQRALTPGTAQQIIYAYGADGVRQAAFPPEMSGGKKVNLEQS